MLLRSRGDRLLLETVAFSPCDHLPDRVDDAARIALAVLAFAAEFHEPRPLAPVSPHAERAHGGRAPDLGAHLVGLPIGDAVLDDVGRNHGAHGVSFLM